MNKMKQIKNSLLLACLVLLACPSCTKDEEGPRLDSVWMNMVQRPIEQVSCAYPGQTISLRGEHMGEVRRVIVNGTDINLNTLFVYQSDGAITIQLPSDVNTTGDNIRVVTRWGMTDFPVVIRPKSEQPAISAFSTTTLIAGRTLTITGTHLDGAEEVWLPMVFGGRVKCEMDATKQNDATTVHVVIPDGCTFATGYCEIVMQKTDSERGITYSEKAYSAETNFK